jgi:hypothetical protein
MVATLVVSVVVKISFDAFEPRFAPDVVNVHPARKGIVIGNDLVGCSKKCRYIFGVKFESWRTMLRSEL